MKTQKTGGEIAATKKTEAVPAAGYDTRALRPSSQENRKPGGDDRDDGGYIHREISPRDRQDIPPSLPPPRSCRTVMVSFREAEAARPPCYR